MNINKKPLFNENGDIEVSKRKMINGKPCISSTNPSDLR